MLSIGLDIGSSSIKACILNVDAKRVLAQGSYPDDELKINAPKPGWAEQDPEAWWECVRVLVGRLLKTPGIDSTKVSCIGISYQMHGLVMIDRDQKVLRPSIIWCDSRAVETGGRALKALGEKYCLSHYLNWPGNFTASKLAWVKKNEPAVYRRVHKIMLPGDYIAMRLTGDATTTVSGLSEGILWDYKESGLATRLMKHYGFDKEVLADVKPTFSVQGKVSTTVAAALGLGDGVVVSYRAGDQPNNALSLGVLEPGEIAATAGTSGVVYGVIAKPKFDPRSRVNIFAHVNHTTARQRLGVLLCINGTGILLSWLRKNAAAGMTYEEMNRQAATASVGSEGLSVLPFGNGAERMLQNALVGGQVLGLDLNRHSRAHVLRAAQEGVAFSFRYGVELMKNLGMQVSVIRAGNANMFLSPVFRSTLSNITGAAIEIFDTDGSQGSAWGAAVGAGLLSSPKDILSSLKKLDRIEPDASAKRATADAYAIWKARLDEALKVSN